jgi:hypothetical protein
MEEQITNEQSKKRISFTKKTFYYTLVGLAIILLGIVAIAKWFNIDLLEPSSYAGAIIAPIQRGFLFMK